MKDSRQYRFPYLIRKVEDLPEDFPLFDDRLLFPALFLPRDDPDWFGRSENPARVIFLTDDTLEVRFHPESQKKGKSLAFYSGLSVETGRLLLIGWIGFSSPSASVCLPFNRRVDAPVEAFLGMLRARLLSPAGVARRCFCVGDPLDLKFQNALGAELDKDESQLYRIFVAPRRYRTKYGLFRRTRSAAGQLLCLTDRRLLWINDQHRGSRSQYGFVTCWAHPGNVRAVRFEGAETTRALCVFLGNEQTWKLEIPGELQRDAEEFKRHVEDEIRVRTDAEIKAGVKS